MSAIATGYDVAVLRKHRGVAIFFLVVLVLLVWGAVAGALCASGYTKAKAGRDAINVARDHADTEGLRDGTVQTQLAVAAKAMKAAHSRLANPVVQPWRLFPYVGRQISSAIDLTHAGYEVGSTGSDALGKVSALTRQTNSNRQATLTQLASITRCV